MEKDKLNNNRQFKPKKKAMINALIQTDGNITRACKIASIVRATHYNWLESDPEYKRQVDEIPEMFLDEAEEVLKEKIREKDTTSLIFFLKTKGKHRGYVERTEQEQINQEPIKIVVNGLDRDDTGIDEGN